jgi:probable phosphoglycerate mutase
VQPSFTRLILIRHGHAQAALDGVVAGHNACRGLSPSGTRQAERLRDRLAATGEVEADVLVTSILPRAIETAAVIAPALGLPEAAQDCDLCELHPGEADGLAWPVYRERYGFDMRAEPERPMSPGGDSLSSFQARVDRRIAELAAEHEGKTIVIVCHGGVISAATHGLIGSGGLHGFRPFYLDPENTSITEWRRLAAGADAPRDPAMGGNVPWHLVRFNDAAHLVLPPGE